MPRPRPHSYTEDFYAFCVGTSLIVTGLILLRSAGLVTSGIAGVALLLSYVIDLPLGLLFTLANLPFFFFGALTMGKAFAARSFGVNLLVSGGSIIGATSVHVEHISPAFAAIFGGTSIGMGVLSIARHGAGVGGTGILALWLYRSRGWNAGIVALAFDTLILLASVFTVPIAKLFWSAISIIAIHGVVFAWHRADRYLIAS